MIRAVVFDLGGTLVEFPEWDERAGEKWSASYDALEALSLAPPRRDAYVRSMREAELDHWRRVETEQWSGPPTGIVAEGFRRLGVHPEERQLLVALDGYVSAIAGWSRLFPDTVETLVILRERGYRLGLLSNTWWAAEWHNADLAAHGIGSLLDELVYTSDLPHSKPHPDVFLEVLGRLGVGPDEALMVGDRMIDDVSGAKALGMRAVWKRNAATPVRDDIEPDAVIDALAEVPPLVEAWRRG
ncbi:MAG TPA: HAD family hydrolase [Candidatus Limnocylindria bacterium]|nr:HAD family hydrolase [Candidatus Limnocylindria bacterium]